MKVPSCSDCKHFDFEESYDDTVAWCNAGHDDLVGWNTKPCSDFANEESTMAYNVDRSDDNG